jgi:phosphatidylglycerophosphatase A
MVKNHNKDFLTWCALLGPCGLFPMPGTVATIASMPIVYLFYMLSLPALYKSLFFCALFIFATYAVRAATDYLQEEDSPHIVIDELLGILVTFVGMPMNWSTMLFGFLLFRTFDIFKWAGISYVEELPGVWGVLLDDIVAGLYSCLILHIAFSVW